MRRTRTLIGAAVVAALTTVVSACSSSGATEAGSHPKGKLAKTLRVAVQSDTEQIMLKLAGEDDFPYKVQWSTFEGVPNMVSAFQAGAVDIGTGGQAPIIQAQAGGHDLKIVAVHEDTGNSRQLIARGGGIHTVADLKGKKIATQVGTQTYAFIVAALREAGLTASDVHFVDLTLADSRTALQAGSVDAAAMPTSDVLHFQHAFDDVTVLRDQTGLDMTQSVVISTGKALADPVRSATIGDFVSRWTNSINWIAQHPQKWVQASYVQDQKLSDSVGKQVLLKLGPPSVVPIGPAQIEEQQKLADLLYQSGSIKQRVNASREYDSRFNSVVAQANQASGGPVKAFPASFS